MSVSHTRDRLVLRRMVCCCYLCDVVYVCYGSAILALTTRSASFLSFFHVSYVDPYTYTYTLTCVLVHDLASGSTTRKPTPWRPIYVQRCPQSSRAGRSASNHSCTCPVRQSSLRSTVHPRVQA